MTRSRLLAVVGLVPVLVVASVASGLVGAAATPRSSASATATTAERPALTQADSTVSIVETGVTSGSTFEYELDAYDRIENFSVEVTGRVASEDDVDEGTVSADGGTASLPIAGTMDPTGPAGGEPELTLTAQTETRASEYIEGNNLIGLYGRSDSEVRVTRAPETIGSIRTYHERTGGPGAVVDVYIVDGEGPDATYGEGTLVKDGWEVPDRAGWQTIDIEPYTTNSSTVTVEFVTTTQSERSFVTRADDRWEDGEARASWDGSRLTMAYRLEVVSAPPRDVSVTADDGATASFGDFSAGGTSRTRAIDLSANATELTVDATGSETFEWSLAYTERTASVNPSVSVNGNRANVSRTLAEGETVSLPTDPSWVEPGTNTVVVTVGGSSLSDDAPAPTVDLRYSHEVVGLSTPTPTPEPTPEPTPPDDDTNGAPSGGGGSSDDESVSNDDAPIDDDDDDDDDSTGGASGGGGSSGGGGASVSNLDEEEETPTATPTATATATATPTPTPTPSGALAQAEPNDTVVTDVSFEPSRISTNVQTVVVVTVRNPQSTVDTHVVELELFGQVVTVREVRVPPGGEATVEYATTIAEPGTYTARVDGETATVTVVDPDAGTPTSTSTRFPGFTALTALLAVLAVCAVSAVATRTGRR